MIQIKKTILTLVALLAVTTGAWATEFTSLKVGDVLHVGDVINTSTNYTVCEAYLDAGLQPATVVRANIGIDDIIESETGAYYLIKGNNDFYYGVIIDDGYEGGYWPVTDTSDGISVTAISPGNYTELTFAVHEGVASSGPKVAWDEAEKTGKFTMPGGNVTLEPEYYPQAALTAAPTAIDNVPATTDGAIVKAGTVANIGETTTAQGTVMYYVSPTALDDAALLALAADQWTADVPTAKSLAQGQAYVYYYVRGNDSDNDAENFSDGDILAANALTVTIAAEPTYAVTFAEGTDPNEWTASPATDVKKGTEVTVTYSGQRKVMGVKAEKKKRPEFVPGATIQNIESFVEVENNRDGTITLHMPTLNPSTYNVTGSGFSNGEHTLHFDYEKGSGTNMSPIGANIIEYSWAGHTPFSELDKTIDITSGEPRVAILITGHVQSATCPAPGKEHYWGLYRYTNPVKVTYNLGGGSVSGSTADKVEYLFSGDALATTFAAPTREGYTFDGWYTSAEGGTKLTASNATSATTIYAHWNAIAE
ncbi:InlB B-repeat-containing protein [Prevotella sp. E2-28]|uniref:InlB B-repeat-containing protein n=1 Tax=Prevotella sp. E2-28 TaxID=2913620 RepID=UPI0021041EFD|nr:InlB B-repeat-containing protein [Prevotella sp. E2-28]